MRVLLTNPPWFIENKQGVRAGSRWPHLKVPEEEGYMPFPFFLAYANNLLKKHNIQSKIIDAIAENISYETFYDKIKTENPEFLFIETSTPSLQHDLSLIRTIREFYKGKIIVGGMHSFNEEFLIKNKEIDLILFGEYEFTLLEIIQNKRFELIKGLIYRNKNKILKNEKRILIKNLDVFPWTYSKELPMKKYHDCPGSIPSPSIQMWASRGCPYSCSFCAWPQIMYKPHNYRIRSIKDIVDEIEFLKTKGFKSYYFDDDTFNVGKKRMLEFCSEIKKRKINLPWAIMARVDIMDFEILQAMKKAGLHALKYGVESSNQELLNACNKELDIELAEKNILLTKELGIKVHLTFTFGLPGETKETIQDTINFALRIDPESVQFSVTTPFPGTKFYEELENKNELMFNDDFDENFKALIKNEHLSPQDLEEAVNNAYKIWIEHKERRSRYERSPIILFKECLKEHGLKYTIKKISSYVINKKYKKTENLILKGIKTKEETFIGPEYVTIDLTNKCNLNCIACWTFSPLLKKSKPAKKWFKEELDYKTIKKLICDLSKLKTKEIRITGGGEPFLHKDIFKIIKLIKSKGMRCDLTTNMTLISKKEIDKIVKLKVDNLTVSLWASDEESYKNTHPRQTKNIFNKIKNNIIYLSKIKTNTKIVIANVLSNVNYNKVKEMVLFGKEVNANEVYFAFIDPIKGETDVLLLNQEQRKELLRDLKEIKVQENNIKIDSISNLIRRLEHKGAEKGNYDQTMIPGMKCYVGLVFARIMANGDVAPCCRAVNDISGNINTQSFKEIWNGKLQNKFRRNGLEMNKKFTNKIGCYKTCDNWWQNKDIE